MLNTNPFSTLAEIISPIAMQGFIIAMVMLIAVGTIILTRYKTLKLIQNLTKGGYVKYQPIFYFS